MSLRCYQYLRTESSSLYYWAVLCDLSGVTAAAGSAVSLVLALVLALVVALVLVLVLVLALVLDLADEDFVSPDLPCTACCTNVSTKR